MMEKKKRKQHYVWEHYLRAWATDGQVWCLHGDRSFSTNTDNVANERDFYRLKEMSDDDIAFVERVVVGPLERNLQEVARGWLIKFQAVFVKKREYESSGERVPEVEHQLDVEINNLEEDMHESIEGSAIAFLAELRDGRDDFMADDENFVRFARFIATQYMRTPVIAGGVAEALHDMPRVDIAAIWGVTRTIYATNLSFAFFRRRHMFRTTFLSAAPSVEFITGDQPIVNVRAVGKAPDHAPTEAELELFYPLSPKLGVLFAFDAQERTTERRDLTAAEVTAYNDMIIGRSKKQLYAASRDALPTRTTG